MTAPYAPSRIRAGVLHFVTGKAVSSLAGMLALVLVLRALPVEDFAAYALLQAFVEFFSAISGLGLMHMLLRYVPELYAQQYSNTLRRFVALVLGLRMLSLVLVLVLALAIPSAITSIVGLAGRESIFQAFLWVVLFRIASLILFQFLESTLHQGLGQIGLSTCTLLKLLIIGYYLVWGGLDLPQLVWIEAITELAGLLVMALGVVRVLNRPGAVAEPAAGNWLQANRRRVVQFGIRGYLQHLMILPYGSAFNRFAAGHYLASAEMAIFGFAQAIADLLRRYLPAQMFAGLIRPVFVARFSSSRDFASIVDVCNLIFKINLLLLGAAAAMLLAGGGGLIQWVTAGRYGDQAALVVLAMCGVLALETRRHLLELMVQTVEGYGIFVASNLILSTSLLLGIGLMPHLGVYAMPCANAGALLAGNSMIVAGLARRGYSHRHDWASTWRILAAGAAAAAIGNGVSILSGSAIAGSIAALFAYLLILVLSSPLSAADLGRIRQLRNKEACAGA